MTIEPIYKARPVEVTAVQWNSGLPEQQAHEIAEWTEGRYDPYVSGAGGPNGEDWGCLEIETPNGDLEVAPYDYVVTVGGDCYVYKPAAFASLFKPAGAA